MVEAIIGVVLVILSSVPDAIKDTVSFHFFESVFKELNMDWWNPNISWANKYKNQDPSQGPKFFGSTTFMVWVTDAWHLFGALYVLLLSTGMFLIGFSDIGDGLEVSLAISSMTLSKGLFEGMFSKFLLK
jgi:hypothetical protein